MAVPLSAAAEISNADHAADVCAPILDPCVIRERVIAAELADLDFGSRALEIHDGGRIAARASTFGSSSHFLMVGCDISLVGEGQMSLAAEGADMQLRVGDTITTAPATSIDAKGGTAGITMVYGGAAPLLQGGVSPARSLVHDPDRMCSARDSG